MTAQILIGALLIGDIPMTLPACEVSLASSAHTDLRPRTTTDQHHPIRTPQPPQSVSHTVLQRTGTLLGFSCHSTHPTTDTRCRELQFTLFHPPISAHMTPPGA